MDKDNAVKWLKDRIFPKSKGKGDERGRISLLAVIIVVAAAALILLLTKSPGGTEESRTAETPPGNASEQEYVSRMEQSLETILEKISGAGDVSVRIYIDSTGEKVLAEESKKESESQNGSESSSSETRPVTSSSSSLGGDGEPYVVREKLPYPIGVIVVSEGARDSLVRNEIYEAVKALYGLSANRIKITY